MPLTFASSLAWIRSVATNQERMEAKEPGGKGAAGPHTLKSFPHFIIIQQLGPRHHGEVKNYDNNKI